MVSPQQKSHLGKECECGRGYFDIPISSQEWHLTCSECNAIIMVYEPLPHQEKFHADPHKYKMFAGGYGSGKTTTACMEAIDHILETPNGTTLIGAETLPQLEQTAMKEFIEVFPEELIVNYSRQKNFMDMQNGHRVIFRPLDDDQKARSLNLTFFWIEEANGVNFSYFTQLQTRLRNTASKFQRGIISTNPDMNWVKTEILLKANRIHNAEEKYHRKEDEIDSNISVHIAPTHLNTHLPETYYEDTAQGKPDWWIARYLNGSFQNKEGLVYPQYDEHLVDDFTIPIHWKRRIGGDFGLNNPTGVVYLATDPETGVSYIYKTYKQAQKPVAYHAELINEELEKIGYGVIDSMVGDAAGQQRSTVDMTSVFDHYAEYGIYWQPSTKKLEDSIMKNFSYFDTGNLKIFKTCEDIIDELSTYKYPERTLDKVVKDEKVFEKPLAVNDHLLDALRYVVAEMPDDPDQLINKSYNSMYMVTDRNLNQKSLPHALQEDENPMSYNRNDAWLAY